jgi:hypothetical protein
MNQLLSKKEIAAQAGITPRTMRNHREKWSWLEKCRTNCTRRPTYNRERVNQELRRRRLI